VIKEAEISMLCYEKDSTGHAFMTLKMKEVPMNQRMHATSTGSEG
jgi:hypothetical protein